jgi:hypothetical protein
MLDKRTKQTWRGLVDYANAENQGVTSHSLENLAAILFECMPWMARTDTVFEDVPAMIALLTQPDILRGTLEGKPVWYSSKSEQELAGQFREQAIEYQPQLRRLLRWLADPARHGDDRVAAWSFLLDHTRHIEFQRGDPAYAPPEEEHVPYWTLRGEPKADFPYRTLVYKDIADPICDFIHQQYELGRNAPIHICKRPGCGSLITRFKKKEYCRTSLCDKERRKRDDDLTKAKNRDNVFLCRLRNMPLAMRRKKVRESAHRLREIESHWRDRNESLATHASKLLREIR